MDPTTLIRTSFARCIAAGFVIALASHGFAGVVQIGGSSTTSDVTPTAEGSDPQPAELASPVVNAPQVAAPEQGQSAWLTLLDEASSNSRAKEPAVVGASAVHSKEVQRVTVATPGAVIPLPLAIYPALITLGGAGWLAIRSRNGRRL